MADVMNSFFVNIGKTVENKIPQAKKPFTHYIGEPSRHCITLNPCMENEIKSFIDKLDISKASGPFSIPLNVLKTQSEILLAPLTTIVNKSLNEGISPPYSSMPQ